MNIKIFGDSILKGVIYSDAEKRYKLAEGNKYDQLKDFALSVQNNSRMGATIDKGMSLIKRSISEGAQDTLTIMEFGGNDCDYDWKSISAHPEMCYAPKTPVDKFVNMYRKTIAYAKKAGSRIAVASLVPLDSERYMRWITRGLNYQNILRWLGDVDHLFRWQSYYNDIVMEIAAEEDCPVIDLRNAFLKLGDYKHLLCEDGIHPNQAGHDLIGKTMADFFAQGEAQPVQVIA